MSPLTALTGRERDVLHFLAEGLFNREIAERLCIQEETVKYHLSNVFRKLGARNRVEAAITYHVWCA